MLIRRIIFLFLMFVSAVDACSQSGVFNLTFRIKNLPPKYEVILQSLSEKKVYTSSIKIVRLDSITYLATGKIDYPFAAIIVIKNRKGSRSFYLGPGEQFIYTHFDSLYFPQKVIGSKVNDELLNNYLPFMSGYKAADDQWWKDYNNIKAKYSGVMPMAVEDSMTLVKKNIEHFRDSLISSYITFHPDSYAGFWKLYENFSYYGYTDAFERSFYRLNKKIQNSFDGTRMKSKLMSAKQVAEGSIFPHVKLLTTSGKTKLLSPGLSHYTLIDFWYSHCTPCIEEFAELKNIYSVYSPKGFQVIGVSIDLKKDETDWKKAIEKYNLTWANLWDVDGKIAKKFFIELFPTNFLIDRSGKIIKKNISLPDLKNFLARH